MSILGLAAAILIPGGGIAAAIFMFGAGRVLGKAKSVAAGIPWAKVLPVAIVLVAAVSTFLAFHYAGEARHERKATAAAVAAAAHWQAQDKADVAAHLVTKASLAGALAQIDASNARVAAAHAELLRQEQFWAAKDAEATARFKSTAATVAGLEKSAAGPRTVPCKLGANAAKALEGL